MLDESIKPKVILSDSKIQPPAADLNSTTGGF
jgi:hypothetical protein